MHLPVVHLQVVHKNFPYESHDVGAVTTFRLGTRIRVRIRVSTWVRIRVKIRVTVRIGIKVRILVRIIIQKV